MQQMFLQFGDTVVGRVGWQLHPPIAGSAVIRLVTAHVLRAPLQSSNRAGLKPEGICNSTSRNPGRGTLAAGVLAATFAATLAAALCCMRANRRTAGDVGL
jgi:hypothetical protein